MVFFSPTQDICAATPALLLKTNDNKMLLFDLDRNTHGTTRQRKLDDMQLNVGKYKKSGRPKVGNEHYNLQWDAWVQPLVDALERLHGGSLLCLMRRRHLARSLAADASARAKAERDVIGALEQAEVEKAALHIQGNRQSFARYNRARTIRCKEVRSCSHGGEGRMWRGPTLRTPRRVRVDRCAGGVREGVSMPAREGQGAPAAWRSARRPALTPEVA